MKILVIMLIRKIATSLCFAAVAGVVHGETVGPIYPIAEPDLLAVIQSKLIEKERTGELARLQREAQQRSIRAIENPTPVPGLTKAVKTRTFYFDPSITVTSHVTDASGKILVPAGTKVNPLDYVSLSKRLAFFDAREAAQVRWAETLLRQPEGRLKPILTAGSYIDLMRRWKRQVWFDQGGRLTQKFGIKHVPAIVSQEGKLLRIEEIVL